MAGIFLDYWDIGMCYGRMELSSLHPLLPPCGDPDLDGWDSWDTMVIVDILDIEDIRHIWNFGYV